MDNKGHKKVLQEEAKTIQKIFEKRTKQSETEYKVYKNMFESIKDKSKKTYYSQKIIEYKDNAKKMECYERTDR